MLPLARGGNGAMLAIRGVSLEWPRRVGQDGADIERAGRMAAPRFASIKRSADALAVSAEPIAESAGGLGHDDD